MKQLFKTLDAIGKLINMPTSEKQAVAENRTHFLWIEYASQYGGYRAITIEVKNFCEAGAFGEQGTCSRRSAKVMQAYLDGIYNGIIIGQGNG